MKFKGHKIQGPSVEYVVIPKNGIDVVFKCQAVLDYSRFETMVPVPKAPELTLPGGKTKTDFEDVHYVAEVAAFHNLRYCFIALESLKDNPDIEWETVRQDAPETWKNWETELREAGFSQPEINAIALGISIANSFNQEKLEEAKKRFLASLTQQSNAP